MKIDEQKNNLVGQIWYRSLDPVIKTAPDPLAYFEAQFAQHCPYKHTIIEVRHQI